MSSPYCQPTALVVAPMMRLRLFWVAAAVVAPSVAATSSPQCSAVFPPELRIACGSKHGKGLKDTPELCAARGCCWAPSTTEATPTAAPAPAPGCHPHTGEYPRGCGSASCWNIAPARPCPCRDERHHQTAGRICGGWYNGDAESAQRASWPALLGKSLNGTLRFLLNDADGVS